MSLTPKKARFLEFLRSYQQERGMPPTFQEIMNGLGMSSLGTVNWYVQELEKDGYLRRTQENGKRALELIDSKAESLPLLGKIAAGLPIEAIPNSEWIEVPPAYLLPDHYVLQVSGNSMIGDHIQDGDYVVIRQQEQAEAGETVVALINGEATLKRYYPKAEGIELHPRNPDYPVIQVSPNDDFRIQGVLRCLLRNFE
ncbi:MAG TPA: repressor LexA [Candidatus Marinimicrobia bacterium]|nr:repressor LexA [Candidatus Neomarinimicrobiota bacterium]